MTQKVRIVLGRIENTVKKMEKKKCYLQNLSIWKSPKFVVWDGIKDSNKGMNRKRLKDGVLGIELYVGGSRGNKKKKTRNTQKKSKRP